MHSANSNYIFTSESVSEGHPDKVCDQVSDAIVDEVLRINPEGRAAIETMATTNHVSIAGEYRGADALTRGHMNDIAQEVVKGIGYDQEGFDWRKIDFINHVHQQS